MVRSAAAAFVLFVAAMTQAAGPATRPSLKDALANLKVPPDWFATTTVHWDMAKPWQDGRLEVRRLLAKDEAEVREGVKITWLYAQKNDIGDGHELPMYLFMSGQYAWAVQEYPKYLQRVAGKGATHAYLCYASCLAHFGEYARALQVLDQAMTDLPPAPWTIVNQAGIFDARGDFYAQMGDTTKAKQAYAEAIRLLPTSTQPYGKHLVPRRIAKIQTKLDLLTMQSLASATLRDGTYTGKSLGYTDTRDLEVAVTIKAGKIADIQVTHQEKIELNATEIIPKRIMEKQSLQVDVVTGATITSEAVIDGTYRALKQAGLK